MVEGVKFLARPVKSLWCPQAVGVDEKVEAYVDDIEAVVGSDQDILLVDEVVDQFEKVSGAILNRSKKSVILGLGGWKDRKDWPLSWVKTVDKHKVFGIVLTARYQEMLKVNWEEQLQGLNKTIVSWASRVLDNVRARAEALRVFALSRIWYKAQILPLPRDVERRMEEQVSAFLWRGQITRHVLGKATVALPTKRGGLNLPLVGLRCEVLRVRQLVRMILSLRTRRHVTFWLGGKLGWEGLKEEWFVMRKGVRRGAKPVVITSPYYQKWAAMFLKAKAKGIIDVDDLENVTTRQMYAEWMNLQSEAMVVLEEPDKPWSTIWARLLSGLVVDDAVNSAYLLAHNRLGTRERGVKLMPDKYKSNKCPNCDKEAETVVHRFSTCEWVASMWAWMADLLKELDEGLDKVPVLDILRFQYPKGLRENAVTWLVGNYIAIITQEVVTKGRKLQVSELVGMLRISTDKLKHRAVKDVGPIPHVSC